MRHGAAVAALLVLIALTYGASVDHGFVFDDQLLVVDNPIVRLPLSQAYRLLVGPEAGISYRPLRMLSYMVDYQVAGRLDPSVFHVSNLVYHGLVTLALYALAWILIGSVLGAFVAAALFAIHPLGSEAIVYVAGRRDLLSTLCVMLALLCWCALLRATREPARAHGRDQRTGLGVRGGLALAGMLVFAILGIAAKEMAVVLPVLALLIWAARPDRGARRGAATQLWSGILLSAVALVVVGFWLYAEPLGPRFARYAGGALAPQPALSLRVLGQYLLLAAWPMRLSADYRAYAFPLPATALDGPAIVAGLLLAIVALAGIVLMARGSVGGIGLLWFLVALLPVSQIVPYSEVVSEHNAYLALAGLALAAGEGVTVASRKRPRLVGALAAGVLLLLAVRSHARSRDWHDDVTLWRATVAGAPDSVRGQYNLGVSLLAGGDLIGAQGALDRAAALAPTDRDVLLTLATLNGRLGEFERAYDLATRAVEVQRDARSLSVLGWAQLSRGRAELAIPLFEEAIALGGDTADARRGIARARAGAGRF